MSVFFGGGESGRGIVLDHRKTLIHGTFLLSRKSKEISFLLLVTCHLSEFFGRPHVPHRLGTRVDWFWGERIQKIE